MSPTQQLAWGTLQKQMGAARRGSVRDDGQLTRVVRPGTGGHEDLRAQVRQQPSGSSDHTSRTTADQDALARQDRG